MQQMSSRISADHKMSMKNLEDESLTMAQEKQRKNI